jgi:dihydrofolate synthase/folylpolyglutamate synthase
MQLTSLDQWIKHIQSQHRKSIDLGLERIKRIANELDLLTLPFPVITVGGTNGKGSTVAGLEAIYLANDYRVGAFTSPYLYKFNELVRIQGKSASDTDFIHAFEQIEKVRADVTLTQFEFNTLAALIIFKQSNLDIVILEVGLGGRLDAVNIIDADIMVVTSIAIDHADWLGDTREKIGREKAGIFRKHKPAVCGDFDPPHSLVAYAAGLDTPLFCQGRDFNFGKNLSSWIWQGQKNPLEQLPLPHLALQNMSSVLMAVELMQSKRPVTRDAIDKALVNLHLPGRIQVIPGEVTQILDVSHNPAAAEFLANYLRQQPIKGKTRAVFSMLADKDIAATLNVMRDEIDEWYIAALPVERGQSLEKLASAFKKADITAVKAYEAIQTAYETACSASMVGERVVVFGSFYTVAGVKAL